MMDALHFMRVNKSPRPTMTELHRPPRPRSAATPPGNIWSRMPEDVRGAALLWVAVLQSAVLDFKGLVARGIIVPDPEKYCRISDEHLEKMATITNQKLAHKAQATRLMEWNEMFILVEFFRPGGGFDILIDLIGLDIDTDNARDALWKVDGISFVGRQNSQYRVIG